jgi:hypothetical protein
MNSLLVSEKTLEKTEGAFNNGQSRETGNIGLKANDEDKQNKKTQHRK